MNRIEGFEPSPQPQTCSSFPLIIFASERPVAGTAWIMSGSVPPQSETSLLGPGIAGLFIQGVETGLVFSEFSQWCFRAERRESSALSAVVIFVTIVGLYGSSRLLTAWPHCSSPFLECTVRDIHCICMARLCSAIRKARKCSFLLVRCISDVPLMLDLCFSCSQPGQITLNQS
jgi:hypothetical protein